ncbi:polysaccharide export protein EpsE [Methylobacter sp.]|uniref:polysaccharide export protein EpsE n=1 Tax=Methylobacter sp. TaxID=2051955 RepID=UPI0012182FE9|nr:polysaccharide export protein EpsE [Methylobacter sp.]TAK61993.1 MAG: polysaccharide export protein EpsE [Methylobacter sp.]
MHINNRLLWIDKRYLLLMVLLLILPVQQSAAAYNIGPDDVLRISVYGHEDLRTESRVSADGKITFPLIGEVAASGKSTIELEEAIAVSLINGGFVHDAQVSVTVVEQVSQRISVLGYVNKPGRYPLNSNSSIVDMIAMAEGINEMGDHKVVVTRIIDGKPQKWELDLLTYLGNTESTVPFKMQQGDEVYVPKAPMFYIYGEVQRPGGYRIEPEISVVKALSIGGGLTPRGTENGIVIKRKSENGELQETDVELSDAVLKDDVIYVSERWF